MRPRRNNNKQAIDGLLTMFKGFEVVILFFVFVLFLSTNPYSTYVMLAFCLSAVCFCGFYKKIDRMAIWLSMFAFFYALISLANSVVLSYTEWIGGIFAPWVFYLFGKKIAFQIDEKKTMLTLLLIVVFLYAVVQYLNVFLDIAVSGLVNIDRLLYNEKSLNFKGATLVSVNVSYGFVGLITFFTIKKPFKSVVAYCFLAIMLLSLIATIHFVNRSGLVVAAICIPFLLLYRSENRIGKFFKWMLLLAGLGLFIYQIGIVGDDVISAFEMRFTGDIENTESMGGRSGRWGEGLVKMFEYPFGWSNNMFTNHKYAHNFWVDVARVAGVVPFFLLLVVTIRSISLLVKIYRFKQDPVVATLIGLYICFFFSSFVEPIMEGAPIHFFLSCFFIGITQVYYKRLNRSCSNNNQEKTSTIINGRIKL